MFNTRSSFEKIVRYPLIYLAQYLIGAGLLHLFASILDLSKALGLLIVVGLLLPVSYSLNKKILTRDFTRDD